MIRIPHKAPSEIQQKSEELADLIRPLSVRKERVKIIVKWLAGHQIYEN